MSSPLGWSERETEEVKGYSRGEWSFPPLKTSDWNVFAGSEMATSGNSAFYCEIPLPSLMVHPTLASVEPEQS